MNDDAIYRKYREIAWRRPLSSSEQAELRRWLAAHPELQEQWSAEAGLNLLLDNIPDVPVASNFTAGVLRAVELQEKASRRRQRLGISRVWSWQWPWLPRTAFLVMVGAAGLVTFHHLHDVRQQQDYARSVVAISSVETLPNPAVLENFDAIRAMDQTPGPDEELLKLYQ